MRQPDGTQFRARLWGDEHLHGWETADGYTIARDRASGFWHYQQIGATGDLETTLARPGLDAPPPGVRPGVRPTETSPSRQRSLRLALHDAIAERQSAVPSTGTANLPVILVTFSDRTPTTTAASFDSLLFGMGNFSVADYYWEVSYNEFTVAAGPSGIGGWYAAPNTHDYYGANDPVSGSERSQEFARDAVAAADAAGFNFAPYDSNADCQVDTLLIVHQGAGEEAGDSSTDMWSRFGAIPTYTTSSVCPSDPGRNVTVSLVTLQPELLWGSTQSTIGVFAHEFGHALGLPDVYDPDGSSEGVGRWSLMGSGNWNSVGTTGDRPAHLDPWSKWRQGWIAPTPVTTATTVSLPAAEGSSTGFYRLLSGSAPSQEGEYFLLENRQKTGFDTGLPGAGMLIWHVEESTPYNFAECWPGPGTPPPLCSATQHYKVALVQADNLWNLEKHENRGDAGDPYPGTANNTAFTGETSPASGLYSGTPSGVSVAAISPSGATMTATLQAPVPGELSITKTDGQATAIRGASVTYTIVVSNDGPNAVNGATVRDAVPSAITGATWTCSGAGGGSCTPSGSGNIDDTVDLPAGGTATYTLTGTVDGGATGSLTNTATVTAPDDVTESDPTNNSATDTDTLTLGTDLSITKTDGQTTAVTGQPITYTIVVSNAGPNAANGATVTDTMPSAITSATWTCAGAGGGHCTAGGFGDISDTVNLPVGGSVTYTLTGTVGGGATGSLTNTATVAAPGDMTDPELADNSAADTDTLVGLGFFTLVPCRLFDTRDLGAPIGGPVLHGQETRSFAAVGYCDIPSTARALSINVTATQPSTQGHVRLFPAGEVVPTASNLNFAAGQTRANNAIISLNPAGELSVFVAQPAGSTVHLIIDVNGYFDVSLP